MLYDREWPANPLPTGRLPGYGAANYPCVIPVPALVANGTLRRVESSDSTPLNNGRRYVVARDFEVEVVGLYKPQVFAASVGTVILSVAARDSQPLHECYIDFESLRSRTISGIAQDE
jgi:hypothetical protein